MEKLYKSKVKSTNFSPYFLSMVELITQWSKLKRIMSRTPPSKVRSM